MVQPTVLKRRHSLKGKNLLPMIKKIRGGKPESLKEFARIDKDTKTEKMSIDEIAKAVKDITAEDLGELFELAGIVFDNLLFMGKR